MFDTELCFHRFPWVRYTGRVVALHHPSDCWRQLNNFLRDHRIIPNYVDRRIRGDQRNFINFGRLQFSVLDLDDIFVVMSFALDVNRGTNDFAVFPINAKYHENLQRIAWRDVIDDGAVLDLPYVQLLSRLQGESRCMLFEGYLTLKVWQKFIPESKIRS